MLNGLRFKKRPQKIAASFGLGSLVQGERRGNAHRQVGEYVKHYNTVRLHSAIGYVTPKDKLEGREQIILAERDRKLQEARERRKARRQAANESENLYNSKLANSYDSKLHFTLNQNNLYQRS